MKYMYRIVILLTLLLGSTMQTVAQDVIVNPDISYAGTPRTCEIGGIAVKGVDAYEDYVLSSLSGLSVGQQIEVPGSDITEAVKRYWKHGLFSRVQITADSLVGSKIYLCIHLSLRPRVSEINYNGLKKSEREDMEAKLGIMRGSQITPNMIDRAKILAKKYFDQKGYKNAEIEIMQRDDVTNKNQVILDVNVDKKAKMKVRTIFFEGNEGLNDKKIKGSLFTKGSFGKIHEAGKLSSWFKSKKFTDERYREAKDALVDKYNELGYRDMTILEDSVWTIDDKHVNVLVKIDEGQKYYIRNITWVGNTVLTTDALNATLGMKKGDVYNQRLMQKRLTEDEDAVGNYYWNNGYLFYQLQPTEVNIVEDSIDVEMRIYEGTQAHLNHVRIYGNDRLYEEVVRRELRTKPGDLFSKESLQRSARDIASMGHFDPEKVNPDIKPNYDDGTVDVNWELEQKSNDQIEFSLGWGQTGVIGRVGLKLNNFSMRNLFGKNKMHRGLMPIGDGETLGINFQTNGSYYRQYSISYGTNWFGNKRPNMLNVSMFYSKQSDISSYYRNNALYNGLYGGYGYGYGYGSYNNYAYNYESMLDDDKNIRMFGASISWGRRLRWPDDYFQFMASIGYTRYMLRDWNYFYIANGNCNNLNLGLTLSRTSTDNQLFPRRGSEFMVSLSVTPPWSLFDGKDYSTLALNSNSATYESELQDMYRWIEYHKWKFKTRTFTPLTNGQKCFVLMTRFELGILGSFNKDKKSPFETFYVGGDGMSGYSYSYAEETIGMRGYDNGSLSTSSAYTEASGRRTSNNAYAYDRFTLELRYPFMLGNTTIYGLGFLEGGNAWADVKKFNPFNMKRSAGAGVRIFLPMVGLMGIDWAYGFDKVYTSGGWQKGGSQFHFVLGQEF